MPEPDLPARRVVAVGLAVAATVGVVWAAAWLFGTDGPADPTAQLTCLDGQHRPSSSGDGPSVVHLGITVSGPVEQYRPELHLDDGSLIVRLGVGATDELVVFTIPTTAPVLGISRIDAVRVGDDGDGDGDGDAERTDVTAAVLGVQPWTITLGETEGQLREGVPVCPTADEGDVHRGFVFAPPSPAFDAAGASVTGNTLVQVEEFVTRFAQAHADGDADALIAALHPVVIAGYGDEICRAHITATVGWLPPLEIVTVAPVLDYRFERPGEGDSLVGVVAVEALATLDDGGTKLWRFNLVIEDGVVSWLSWCGN